MGRAGSATTSACHVQALPASASLSPCSAFFQRWPPIIIALPLISMCVCICMWCISCRWKGRARQGSGGRSGRSTRPDLGLLGRPGRAEAQLSLCWAELRRGCRPFSSAPSPSQPHSQRSQSKTPPSALGLRLRNRAQWSETGGREVETDRRDRRSPHDD